MNTEQSKSTFLTGRFLSITIGEEEFGIPLTSVREVIALPKVTPLPFSPPYLLGVMNLRGLILPVLDLRLKFKQKVPSVSENTVIVCEVEGQLVGALVDSVNSVFTAEGADTSEVGSIGVQRYAEFITGVYKTDQGLTLLIDPTKALHVEGKAKAA